jgi:hypothetical protein
MNNEGKTMRNETKKVLVRNREDGSRLYWNGSYFGEVDGYVSFYRASSKIKNAMFNRSDVEIVSLSSIQGPKGTSSFDTWFS